MRVGLILCTALAHTLSLGANGVQAQPGLEDVGFVLGDTAAPVKIIEFSDFGCSTCADFWRESWPRIRHDLIDTGRVVWWQVPVAVGYRHGKKAANAAQCAAEQDGYWRMHELLLGGQDEWLSTRRPQEVYIRMAREAGLDWALCLSLEVSGAAVPKLGDIKHGVEHGGCVADGFPASPRQCSD